MAENRPPVRILHLEDSARDADLIRILLNAAGSRCEMIHAAHRAQFEEALERGGFDLILCDFNLADFDGLSALKLAKAKHPAVPVIIVSGALDAEEAVECLRAGATDYLFKQRLERLPSAVQRALDEAQAQAQRQESEARLRESETRFRAVAENLGDGLVLTALDDTILDVNPRLTEMTGYTREELIGHHGYEHLNDASDTEEMKRHNAERAEGRSAIYEMQLRRKNGTRFETEITGAPLRDSNGAIFGTVGVIRDISERKQAQEQLQESNEMFRSLARVAPVGIFRSDEQSRCTYVNRHLCIMTGLSEEQALGDGWSIALHPEDRARIFNEWNEAVRQRAPFHSEFRFQQPDGAVVWVLGQASELTGADGRVLGHVGTVFNITAQKQTEAVLRALSSEAAGLAHEAFFQFAARRLAETLGVEFGFVGRLDGERDDHIQTLAYWADDQFAANILYPLEGTPCENVVGKDLCIYPSAVQQQFPRDPLLVKKGIVSYAAIPLRDSSGGSLGLLCAMSRAPLRDLQYVGAILKLFAVRTAAEIERQQAMTVLERTAGELREAKTALEAERAQLAGRVAERTAELTVANAELEHANRLKSEFLANMSHELRTPLNAILGLSEALLEQIGGPLTPRQVRSTTTIHTSGQHLLALINDILDLSKIEAGKLELRSEKMSVNELCQSSLGFVKTQAMKKRIQVAAENDGRATHLRADPKRLKQILVNLLTNAVKFTPEGGSIGLTVTAPPGEDVVRFTVWDTGIGLAPDDAARLFRPFTQIDSGLNRAQEGTGLGLALVAKLADLHGGSVAVESAPGQGSRFTVTLPLTPEPEAGSDRGGSAAPERKSPHVVIVEDEPEMAYLLGRYLTGLGFRSVVCARGDEAVETIGRERPKVVLLDIELPGISGWEVLKRLKADSQTHDIPVLVVSGAHDPEQSRALGAAGHLTKPFTCEQFLELLEHSVGRKAAPSASAAPRPASRSGARILLAEDNEANIETLGGYLEESGYDMHYAPNGLVAVNLAREIRPALILMDVQMPVMDGLTAIREIRADPALREIPIITLTGLAMPGDRERCLEAGAVDYLTKPVSLRELVQRMQLALDGARSAGERAG